MALRTLPTNAWLHYQAQQVRLAPPHNGSVFFFGSGYEQAQKACAADQSLRTLNALLRETPDGSQLQDRIQLIGSTSPEQWKTVEEVWWTLSCRFAKTSSGVVRCFGPERDLDSEGSPAAFRSRFGPRFMDEIFWKVEYPALVNNERISAILLNGKRIDDRS